MIFPTPLTASLESAQRDIDRFLQLTPQPQRLQIDVVDGEYADNLTLEPADIRELNLQHFSYDLHLMTVDPAGWLQGCAGDVRLHTVLAQVERMGSLSHYVADVLEYGWRVGLSFDLHTPIIETLEELSAQELRQLSAVQVMGNFAGHQGKPLHPGVVATLAELISWRKKQSLTFRVVVDIGVNDQTLPSLLAVGVDDVAVGSFLAEHREDDDRTVQERWERLIACVKTA